MNETLALGPLVLPVPLLLAAGAFLLAGFVGRRLAGAQAAEVERQLLRLLLAGVVAARLAFVLQFRDAYRAAPLGMLDIRDGGWNAIAGLAVAFAYAGFLLVRRPSLRRPLAAALATAAGAWVTGALVLSMNAPDEVRMPALALPSLEGPAVPLASFEGRPTVVNLWATWCPPCQREMPVLQQAQAARPGVHFVFVNQGESAQQVQAFLRKSGLPLRNVLLDGRGETATQLGHRALPTTLFFDARGRPAA
ncbi:MAG: TlpA family protein disulfide reductase, partial [Comamonadaceae bacterium]